MTKKITLEPETKVTVVGDIHAHGEQFKEIVDIIKPSPTNIIVSVGDVYNKGFGDDVSDEIVKTLRHLQESNSGYVIQGNHELKRLRQARKTREIISDELAWMLKQPFALSFQFSSGSWLTVVHGGVTPDHKWDELGMNSDVVYIRELDEDGEYIPLEWTVKEDGSKILKAKKEGKPWHIFYDGRFGFIASGHHAQKDGIVKEYPHSCNLDTACYHTGILSAQVFSDKGKEQLIQVTGPAANKDKAFRE
jgi:predicted phosphodiesterase